MHTNPTSSIYLNTAACGIVSQKAMQAGFGFYEKLGEKPSLAAEHWRSHEQEPIRETIADFIGAGAQNVALIPNFSFGINAVIQALKGTERVLLYKQDYPSLIQPFIINDFNLTWFDSKDEFTIDLEEVEKVIIENAIEVLALSHVQWLSGFKIDLKKLGSICRQHSVLLLIDGTQSLGASPINLSELEVDAFISSNYKWMNAGFGTGILYLSDSFLNQYPARIGGYNSFMQDEDQLVYRSSIRSYEPGHLNMFGFTILREAIFEKQALGLESIAKHNNQLTEYCINALSQLSLNLIGPHNMENRSSIFFLKNDHGLAKYLRGKNMIFTLRNGNLRLSIHFSNSENEIKTLIQILKDFSSEL